MSFNSGGPAQTSTTNFQPLTGVFDGNGKLVQLYGPGGVAVPYVDPNSVAIGGGTIGGSTLIRGRAVATTRALKVVTPLRAAGFRKVMASPPTTTLTTTSTITSPLLWQSVSASSGSPPYAVAGSSFSYARSGGASIRGTTFPDYAYVQFTNVNYGGGTLSSGPYMVSVMHDGAAIEFSVKGTGGVILCKVDDEFISLTPQSVANDGAQYYYYIPFGSTKKRRVDFIAYNAPFAGINTAQTDALEPAVLRGPRCVIVGDSFTEGTGSNQTDSWPQIFAEAMGWDDVWQSGVGGTGYLAAPNPKLKFRDRFLTDVVPANPDVVMFAGGINDYASFTTAQIQTEAAALFALAKQQLPNALLVAVAPFWRNGAATLPGALLAARDAIRTEITNAGGLFVDPLEMPLPLGYTPQVTTLSAGISAGATSLTTAASLASRATYKFANGDRFRVKAMSGSGPFTITPDSAITGAHTAGETITQVGDCFWTGVGKSGVASAPTLSLGTASAGGTFAAGSYFWKVTATNAAGETMGSNEVTATLTLNQQQALSWTSVPGATGYKLYRGTAAGAENALIVSQAGTTYTDTGTAGGAASVPASNTTGPTGYGNSDIYVSSDGTHPTPAGHVALAQCIASLLVSALA